MTPEDGNKFSDWFKLRAVYSRYRQLKGRQKRRLLIHPKKEIIIVLPDEAKIHVLILTSGFYLLNPSP